MARQRNLSFFNRHLTNPNRDNTPIAPFAPCPCGQVLGIRMQQQVRKAFCEHAEQKSSRYDFSNHYLGDKGTIAVAAALRSAHFLMVLNLRSNGIRDAGAETTMGHVGLQGWGYGVGLQT